MKLIRKNVTLGIVTVGIVGGLAVGGVALASPAPTTSAASTTSASAGHCGGDGMIGPAPMTAVARYLGMGRADLQHKLQSGLPLADLAKAHGKSVAGVERTMVAAMKSSLAANPALTPKVRAALLDRMRSHLDAMVGGTHMSGTDMDDMGGGMMDGPGHAMMGG